MLEACPINEVMAE